MIVIEMNPRVSRSSALASKATGFPIAKIAAKLAIGYTLDELRNDITGGRTPASFEPSIDYVVVKIPRFTFEKFPNANSTLTTQMKSVGEVMAIGRTFQESLQKALRSLETNNHGLTSLYNEKSITEAFKNKISTPSADRMFYVGDAFRLGMTISEINELTDIDHWFLNQIEDIIRTEEHIKKVNIETIEKDFLFNIKKKGFSDLRIAELMSTNEISIRSKRKKLNIKPVYKRVDTCAAEFETSTAYLYSTYEEECESLPTNRKKIIILGGGPNRIGQGIEFDYCCVHASYAVAECGYESIMINCNPETVSTDYDTSDRLYFESLTFENVMAVIDIEKPNGIIIQFGGQTPLKLARQLLEAGAPIIGTSPDSIDLAEDRERFKELVGSLDYLQPSNEVANNSKEAIEKAKKVKYPLVVRPSYVLGGRAMEIVYNDEELNKYMDEAVKVSNKSPVLLDNFLDKAIEVDVDAVSDGQEVFIGGIMEHIEQAGVHSGDSSCSIPPVTLSNKIQKQLKDQMIVLAKSLNVIGLVNAQFAIQQDKIFIIEVNPRASRTVPFVSKSTGNQLAKIAAKTMIGIPLKKQKIKTKLPPGLFSVKGPVFPFNKFPDCDPILGPEMKSTGEVMGTGSSFGEAYIKSQRAAGIIFPQKGNVFLSVKNSDKMEDLLNLARVLIKRDFKIIATKGTCEYLTMNKIVCSYINKVHEGQPHIVNLIRAGAIDLIINTTEGKQSIKESFSLRAEAVIRNVTYYTSLEASIATMDAFDYFRMVSVNRLQDYYLTDGID
jgi:carbamoyl-phosphate synthase large subunit